MCKRSCGKCAVRVGDRLPIQPVVRLVNTNNHGVSGLRVRALAPGTEYFDSYWNLNYNCSDKDDRSLGSVDLDFATLRAIDATQDFWLPFSLSEPSDENGYATFKNLLILGGQSGRSYPLRFQLPVDSRMFANLFDVFSECSEPVMVWNAETVRVLQQPSVSSSPNEAMQTPLSVLFESPTLTDMHRLGMFPASVIPTSLQSLIGESTDSALSVGSDCRRHRHCVEYRCELGPSSRID
jgi:hypothetical protein